jgi:hypothetical protein
MNETEKDREVTNRLIRWTEKQELVWAMLVSLSSIMVAINASLF